MWGSEDWESFTETMERVFPGKPITDLAQTDSVMHVLYDIKEKDRTFIPGSRHLRRGPGTSHRHVKVRSPQQAFGIGLLHGLATITFGGGCFGLPGRTGVSRPGCERWGTP